MEAYPFAFSKNPAGAGWSAVVVPSFVEDQEARKLLMQMGASGHEIPQGQAFHLKGTHSKLGIFDVLLREGREQHTDGEGRPFRIYEGLVLRKREPDFTFAQEHLDAAHQAMRPKLNAFWTEQHWTDDQSRSELKIDLSDVPGKTPFKEIVEEQVVLQPKPSSASVAAEAASTAERSGPWTERLRGVWSKPVARGAVVCGAVAAVAVGAFLIAAHQRRVKTRDDAEVTR